MQEGLKSFNYFQCVHFHVYDNVHICNVLYTEPIHTYIIYIQNLYIHTYYIYSLKKGWLKYESCTIYSRFRFLPLIRYFQICAQSPPPPLPSPVQIVQFKIRRIQWKIWNPTPRLLTFWTGLGIYSDKIIYLTIFKSM